MGRRHSIPLAFPFLCGILCAPLFAQPAPDSDSVPAMTEVASERNQSDSASPLLSLGDIVYVQRDGRWVPVPAEEVFPADAAQSIPDPEREPPTVYISSLSLDGEVAGDFAELTADIGIEVTRDQQWQEVALGLQQAHVYEPSYDGPGDAVPAPGLPPEEGVHWLVRGKGSHRLQLRFRLPIKSTPAGEQLQLTLPRLPSGFYARAVLRIPANNAVLRGPGEGVEVRRRELEGGWTEFDCDVKDARWDLSWRNHVDEQPIVSQTSYMRLGRIDGELRLQIRHQCDVSRGSLSELNVRLPTGFTLRDVQRGLQGDRLMWSPIDNREGWVRVLLSPPAEIEESLELNWRLSRPFPTEGGLIQLDGLELEGAGPHIGTIVLESVDGYSLSPPTGGSQGVYQTSTTEPRTGGGPAVLRAFEFQALPFLLEFEIAPIPPRVSATAHNYLWLGLEQDQLHVWTELTVESGQLGEVVWDWPGWSAAGWAPASTLVDVAIVTGDATEIVRGTIGAPPDDEEQDQIRLSLSRPCSGRMRVLLTLNRLPPPDGTDLEFFAVRPAAEYSGRTGTLSIAGERQLEIKTAAEAPLTPATETPVRPAGVPATFSGAAAQVYVLNAGVAPLRLSRVEHARTIRASALVTVTEISRRSIRVLQEIDYQVQYGEIASLLLQLPDVLLEQVPASGEGAGNSFQDVGVEFRLSDGTPLRAERTEKQVRLQLPLPAHDEFRVIVDFVLPLPAINDGRGQNVELPFVRSLDAEFSATLLRIESPETLRLAQDQSGWQFRDTRSGIPAWITAEHPERAILRLDESLLRAPQQFTVDTAFVRTWLDDAGESRTEAEYVIRKAPGRILIRLPEAATNVEFRWNGVPLDSGSGVRSFADQPGSFIIEHTASVGNGGPDRLMLRYRRPGGRALSILANTRIQFPEFVDSVAVTETMFEVVLPPDQQLSDPPSGFVPQYAWERQNVIWMRKSTADYRARRDALGIEPIGQRGNLYAFSTYGPVRAAEFRSMAQSLIVLIGAGLTLLLGFVFGRIPATRNVLSVLVLGFVFALLSLWHLELMQLLMQPALLGLLLACMAVAFDAATRRRRGIPTSRDGSSISRPSGGRGDRQSSIHGSGPAATARTAVYPAEAASQSGGAP